MPHFLIERTIFHQNVSMVSSENKIYNFTSGYQNLGYFKHYYRIKKPITLSPYLFAITTLFSAFVDLYYQEKHTLISHEKLHGKVKESF